VTAASTAALPKVRLLVAGSNVTTTSSTTIDLNGVWVDGSNSNTTYQVQETCFTSQCNVDATYLTDPQCSSAVGTTFMGKTPIFGNPPAVSNDTMFRCTPDSNPIVQNCSQPNIWDTTFNATFTSSTISGEYIGQYWVWNTTSSGAITNCRLSYSFIESFSLTRAPPNSTSSYSYISVTSQNSTGPSKGAGIFRYYRLICESPQVLLFCGT
jgi:hypothetical protein